MLPIRPVPILVAALMASSPGLADPLPADAIQALMSQAPWEMQTGGETNYFVWNDDGSLCVRMYDPAADSCDDEGIWSFDGSEICYELTWWGSAYGQDAACVTVEPVAEGPVGYHAKEPNGMTLLYFSVPDVQ